MKRLSLFVWLFFAFVSTFVWGQGFIIGPNWPLASLPVGIESRVFTVAIVPAPSGPVTLTPSGPNLVFTPTQLDFDQNNLVRSFSFHGTTVSSPTISWSATGGYAPPSNSGISITFRPFILTPYATNLVVGRNATVFSVSTPYPPPSSVTVAVLTDPNEAAVTVQPQFLNFYPNTNDGVYVTAFSNIPTSTSVDFGIGGPDAALYNLNFGSFGMTFNFKNILVPIITLIAGSPRNFTISLDYPPTTSVSITPYATGITFTPSTITISAPHTSAIFQAYSNIQLSTIVNYIVSGPDAGQYDVGVGSAFVTFATITVSAADLAALVVGVNSTFTITLSAPQIGGVTVTPYGNGFTFVPPSVTFSGECVSATMTVVGSIPGIHQIYFELSGPNVAAFQFPVFTVQANVQKRTLSVDPIPTLIAGVPSPQITISTREATATSPIRPPISTLQVTPCSNPSGAITFNPPALAFTNPTSSLSFTMTSNLVSSGFTPVQVSFELSGPDADLYNPPAPVSLTIVRNRFNPPLTYINTLVFPNAAQFPVGVQSSSFGVTATGVRTSVTLTPVSNLVTFDPPVLRFTANENTVYFTITGVTPGVGSISYLVSGNDADLFEVPPPSNPIRVVNRYSIPDIPSLPVNIRSPSLTISVLNSNPSTVFITPSAPNVVFDPPSFLLSSTVTSAQFTVRGLVSTVMTANPNIPGEQYPNNLLFGASATSLSVTWSVKELGESTSYTLSVPDFQSSITILPGYFNISIPNLQLGVTSIMNVTISNPPRSNVVITFLGNNLLFEPASITFLPDTQPTVSLQVTPQIQNNADWNIPFKIDYLCSGASRFEYICPAESFVSVHRRSDATTLTFGFALFFITTLLLLF